MGKRKPRVLTESEWREVFKIRCKTKQGQTVTAEETALYVAAYESDSERYRAMDRDVFNATAPFGSILKG